MGKRWEHRHLGDVPQTNDCVPDIFQLLRLGFSARSHRDPAPDEDEWTEFRPGRREAQFRERSGDDYHESAGPHVNTQVRVAKGKP